MGRGLYPYAVDLALLADLPKPKTPAFAALARRAKKRLAEIDENFEDEIASGELAIGELLEELGEQGVPVLGLVIPLGSGEFGQVAGEEVRVICMAPHQHRK